MIKKITKYIFRILLIAGLLVYSGCKSGNSEFKILILTERGGQHESFASAGIEWIKKLAQEKKYIIEVINNTDKIDEQYLSDIRLFIQLDFPPYGWNEKSKKAFTDYIERGRGGWIGFHHAALLGEFDGYEMWKWFSDFMGGIRFDNYIADKSDGMVVVEDKTHPVMISVPDTFIVTGEEWYTFSRSPRYAAHVLASVDESTYTPPSEIKMGDHPVVWVNEKMKARNVYFLVGHDSTLFNNQAFTTMFQNAIHWAGNTNN